MINASRNLDPNFMQVTKKSEIFRFNQKIYRSINMQIFVHFAL